MHSLWFQNWFLNPVIIFLLEPRIAVTLSPRCVGSLFITDLRVVECYEKRKKESQQRHLSPKVVFLSESPQFASLVSQQAIDQITAKQNELLSKIQESTDGFVQPTDFLLKTAMSLSHASSVAIVTEGVNEKQFEAVVCLAKAFLAQKKEVAILTSESVVSEWRAFLNKCEAKGILQKCISVISLKPHAVVQSLGPRFFSSSLNLVVTVNKEGI